MRRREQKRPRPLVEKFDERAAAGHVSAEHADRLGQSADLNVDAAVKPEMIDGAPPVPSKHTTGVRVVDHHDAAEFFGQRAESRQRAEVSVHPEHAVRDEQLALPCRQRGEHLPRRIDISVGKNANRGPA